MIDSRSGVCKAIATLGLLLAAACFAPGQAIEPAARQAVDAGNQAWIDGMKLGQVAPIVATYTENALDCGPTGECSSGRAAIEQSIKKLLAQRGHAQAAQVTSLGSVQQGDFVYEWGRAEASFADGSSLLDRYLTVWHREAGGGWKIFRNMVIPNDGKQ
jgi:ketosteroid isomerase-like protein